jgi:hypothetical protein
MLPVIKTRPASPLQRSRLGWGSELISGSPTFRYTGGFSGIPRPWASEGLSTIVKAPASCIAANPRDLSSNSSDKTTQIMRAPAYPASDLKKVYRAVPMLAVGIADQRTEAFHWVKLAQTCHSNTRQRKGQAAAISHF